MIIARSPLRVSLGGGGTDLPSYYRDHGGFLLAAAVDKYVFVTVNRPFNKGIFLKYSKLEEAMSVEKVEHPIVREALAITGLDIPKIEITTMADIPAGTGLGSSGSFTTALLKALYSYSHKTIHSSELAELACHIEIDRLGEPIGKQDQYIAAYGGITCFTFNRDDSVAVAPMKLPTDSMLDLEDNLLLFFTGFSRKAGGILEDQKARTQQNDNDMLKNLHYVKEIGFRCKEALEQGKASLFGDLMHEHWENKKRRSGGMSNPQIDEWYDLARKNGAVGGKLVGAGGGGFLMFYAADRNKLRHTMAKAGLEEVRFRFDFEGTKIILS
jgi:D-glycero-alpha-D-manno-heptose-7-phosphate kinase